MFEFEFIGKSLFWAVLSLINLAASILIYHSIKLEHKRKLELEHQLSTRPLPKASISLPRSFIFLSVLTGLINTLGALLRFQQIHFLEIPPIPWSALRFPDRDGPAHEALERAQFLVAMNDWGSLFMALTFLAAGVFNFLTVRQLRLRDQWVKRVLLPVRAAGRPGWYEVVDVDECEELDDKEVEDKEEVDWDLRREGLVRGQGGQVGVERAPAAESCFVGER